MKYNPVEFLDCTLRDGGYYNNWNFNKELINKYLKEINKIKIKYIELGFRTLYEKKIKGFLNFKKFTLELIGIKFSNLNIIFNTFC